VKKFFNEVSYCWDRLKNIAWHKKAYCDVLIFDAEGSDFIGYCIPVDAKVNVLKVREGLPMIRSAYFFLLLFINLCKCFDARRALYTSLINIWKPKVIITFIDNNGSIGNIKSIFPSIRCISVQNGTRWDLSRPFQSQLALDHYFCFGEVEGDILRQGSHSVAHLYPIGSLRTSIFLAQYPPQKTKTFDLCFISQFASLKDVKSDQWTREMLSGYYEIEKKVFNQVAAFASKANLTLCVAMRHSSGSAILDEEKKYFTQRINDRVKFIPLGHYSSYSAAQSSRLSITCSSTLGYEMLGMGERVIFAKDINQLSSHVLKGMWTTNLVTHHLPDLQRLFSTRDDEFSVKANSLLEMNDEDYLQYSGEARKYYMNLDKNNLPQDVIKNKITTFLEESV